MPRLLEPGTDTVYDAAQTFVDAALRRDDSLFSPGTAVWALDTLNDLHERFIRHPDESARPFEVKFKEQPTLASADTIQLAAELLFVHLLATRMMHGETKRSVVEHVLSWSPRPVSIPEVLNV